MKKAITQLISIILVAVIAAGCGFAGACFALRLKESDTRIGELMRIITADSKPVESNDPNALSSDNDEPVSVTPYTPVTINVDDGITVAEAVAGKGTALCCRRRHSLGGDLQRRFVQLRFRLRLR